MNSLIIIPLLFRHFLYKRSIYSSGVRHQTFARTPVNPLDAPETDPFSRHNHFNSIFKSAQFKTSAFDGILGLSFGQIDSNGLSKPIWQIFANTQNCKQKLFAFHLGRISGVGTNETGGQLTICGINPTHYKALFYIVDPLINLSIRTSKTFS